MSSTLFEKIINKEIPSEILYEDDISFVIKDIKSSGTNTFINNSKKSNTKII